ITLTTLAASTNSNGSHLTQVSDGHNQFQNASQTPLQPGEKIRVLLDANNQLQVIPSNLATTPPQIDALKQSLPQQLSAPEMARL
ncbi:hypothetical protein V6238_19915, partial [Marinomonas arenicola]|uniref:hypothetical protein n=1 Tax=Marinomonas arenicola TaxID=569601 RepID=UPI00311FA95A